MSGSLVATLQSPPPGMVPPPAGALSAICELAKHVRASNLKQADDLLTELLVLLHTRQAG